MIHISRTHRRAPTLLAAWLLLAACGGGDGPTASTRDNDPPAPAVGAVAIVGGGRVMTAGDTAHLVARIYDASGRLIADSSAHWTSLDRAIATVAQDGTVQTLVPGRARIVAVGGTHTDTVALTALPGEYVRFSFAGVYAGTYDAWGRIRMNADGTFAFLPYVTSAERIAATPPHWQAITLSTRLWPRYDTFFLEIDSVESATKTHPFPYGCGAVLPRCAFGTITLGLEFPVDGAGTYDAQFAMIRGSLQITRESPRLLEGTFSGEAWLETRAGFDSTAVLTVSGGRFSLFRCPTPNTWSQNCTS